MPHNGDDDLRREIEDHLDLEAEEQIAAGMPPVEARFAARRAFGSLLRTREDAGTLRSGSWIRDARQDAMNGLRMLIKDRAFTTVALVTLALGIGANTAIFSLVHAVMLRPLPFADAGRLVVVWEDFTALGGGATGNVNPANFVDWTASNRVFQDLAAIFGRLTFNLTEQGDPERVAGARVTGNLFTTLGLPPLAGRTILPADDRPGSDPVAVISEGLWRRRFGGDERLIGRSIVLDDVPHAVVGIVPGDLKFPVRADVWVAGAFTAEQAAARNAWFMEVVGRLKAGVSLAQAQDDMTRVARTLGERFPASNARLGVTLVPLHEQYIGRSRTLMLVLIATVTVVLLIACVNVAHLLLARGDARAKELAVRGALGATRQRLMRQLLAESLVLAGLATGTGSALSLLVFRFLGRLVPENLPDSTTVGLNPAVLGFTIGVALVTTVIFGVGPALAASRVDVQAALQRSAPRGGIRQGRGLRGALVIGEVALTVVLVTAAALLLRSYSRMTEIDTGYRPDGLVIAETPLSPNRYATPQRRTELATRVVEQLSQQPGVLAAGYVNYVPMTFSAGGRAPFAIEGRPEPPPDQPQVSLTRGVSPGYLPAIGVPLLKGRHIDRRDGPGTMPVTIINESLARRYWPGGDPVGHRIKLGGPDSPAPWLQIVGVVGDVRELRLEERPEPQVYVPIAQMPAEAPPFFWPRYLAVRTTTAPSATMASIRRIVAAVDPDQPVANLRAMDDLLDEQLAGRRVQLTLIGAFSLLSLLLAAVGLHGVLSYGVSQQSAEIGLRMALGASRSIVMRSFLRRALILTGCGLAIGAGGALLVTRALTTLLYEISPTDPAAFAVTALVLIAVTAVACIAPVRRATRIDPLAALRTE